MTTFDGPVLQLGEGFSEDEVVVLVDGQEVWRGTGVTTNYSVGLADVIRLPIKPARSATVEVRARGSADSAQLRVASDANEVGLRAVIEPAGAVRLGPADTGDVF